jgi:ethanolamine ammonia-lyase large subunit
MNRENLLEVLVKANEFKEGDLLVGGCQDEIERKEARAALSGLRLGDISRVKIVEDGVSETLEKSLNVQLSAGIAGLTINDLRQILLDRNAGEWVNHHGDGLSSEQIASVVKVMSNDELSTVARAIFNPLPGGGISIGSPGHFGSRIQPNSPGDDPDEILFSILDGLSYGCGDVILGINPASNDIETIIRLEKLLQSVKERLALPTRYCVLSDMLKQAAACVRTRVDVGFQSLAGTSKGLKGMLGIDVDGLLDLSKGFEGLYFETGQGSALTNHADEGVDMVTLESRNYGLARYIRRQTGSWMIVNDVAGFIGPEVFRTPDQLLRACLEDTVMAKLHGLTMGLDVCSTFHMGIDPDTLRQLTLEIAVLAAPAYLMAVAGNADPMLGYLTTSFREHPRIRDKTKKRITTAMQARFMELGVMDRQGGLLPARPRAEDLYSAYLSGGGDKRGSEALRTEGVRKLAKLRERGLDLGYDNHGDYAPPGDTDSRIRRIFEQARLALYASIDDSVIRDSSPKNLRVHTRAKSRDDYISHPQDGEFLRREDEARLVPLYAKSRRPAIQIIISDGLNANAVNDNLRQLLPRLKSILGERGYHAGEVDIVVKNGRVRAGYQIGGLLDAELIIHLIGERPGTGLNTLSAYLTYGYDANGQSRWAPDMDHSKTSAICGIHILAKRPSEAAGEIASCADRIMRERRSGVDLATHE